MRTLMRSVAAIAVWLQAGLLAVAADGNRLTYLDEFCDPYWPSLQAARLVTPQWVGEPDVEAVVILSIDDLKQTEIARYEKFVRPIAERLKQIDGRGPMSLMATQLPERTEQIDQWLRESISIEAHTYDHPCPCLRQGGEPPPKQTFDRCVDLLFSGPRLHPIAFRMPCCDSMNTQSPRFIAEVFNKVTPEGHFLHIDSSIFQLFTAADPTLPRAALLAPDGNPRFDRYVAEDRKFVNYVVNYPYPYVIGGLCWELPSILPDDWLGFHARGACAKETLDDLKVALDLVVAKQGLYVLTFHPHKWISEQQIVELIDYAVAKYGRKVKFLNFTEAYDRLTKNLLGGVPLRAADGGDNGVRVLDVNADGFLDAVIANDKLRQTRVWSPSRQTWQTFDFPTALVTRTSGQPIVAGGRFGILDRSGSASLIVRNGQMAGIWHFTPEGWRPAPSGIATAPAFTARAGRDLGVRLRDIDGDGVCELVAAGPESNALYRLNQKPAEWQAMPFALPEKLPIVDAAGRDAGLRFVDVNQDGRADVVFSDAARFAVYLFDKPTIGWTRKTVGGPRGGPHDLPPIVRADGSNNGVWFSFGHMWIQNEQTGKLVPKKNAQPDDYVTVQWRSFARDLLGQPPQAASP